MFFLGNKSSAQLIVFEKQLEEDNPLQNVDLGSAVAPIPVDIDNDNDLFIGTNEGTILFYRNISTEENPDVYEEQEGEDNPFSGVNLGSKASPYFVDVDNDGDADVFIGGMNSVFFFENEGTDLVPLFVEKTNEENPLSVITHVGSRSFSPIFIDVDNDIDFDVFVGWVDMDSVDSQGILYYKNTGTVEHPGFENQESDENPFQNFNELYPNPIFIDADGDGDQDVFIGKGDGIVDYYKNTSDLTSLKTEGETFIGFSMYPNPTSGMLNFSGLEEEVDIHIYNLYGKKIIEKIISPTAYTVNIGSLKAGIYLLTTNIGTKKITRRLVVSD